MECERKKERKKELYCIVCGSSQPSGVQLQSAEAHSGDSMVLARCGDVALPDFQFHFLC